MEIFFLSIVVKWLYVFILKCVEWTSNVSFVINFLFVVKTWLLASTYCLLTWLDLPWCPPQPGTRRSSWCWPLASAAPPPSSAAGYWTLFPDLISLFCKKIYQNRTQTNFLSLVKLWGGWGFSLNDIAAARQVTVRWRRKKTTTNTKLVYKFVRLMTKTVGRHNQDGGARKVTHPPPLHLANIPF